LTKKIERHPTLPIRPPPTSGPAVKARLAPAAQTPTARPRAFSSG
jgi:hypothetical protein